ncbi:molybdenum cofactor biosynthesis protein B [uncultured Cohaesibacter sp.]|uniref:molybdenum cofactor biosynthesis protein B n=1 Tax=uncultured Cohaesibacter sp. TaxID=1002546 RepID=UPI0029C5FE57|nr:molybdenum cofactor biosynthesis protein B [uncultured Cohaesibacter sp.]
MATSSEPRSFIPMKIAILTVSDTRTFEDDKSGQVLVDRLTAAGHHLADRAIVKDEVDTIQAQVKAWVAREDVDVVISTGGTGFTGRDVTPEALEPLFEKKMDGFSWLFHKISYEIIGTTTIQSRATGGVANATYIFCIPGSSGACKDAWDGIFAHQLDYRHMPSNFVEIMPRLNEHLKRTKLQTKEGC